MRNEKRQSNQFFVVCLCVPCGSTPVWTLSGRLHPSIQSFVAHQAIPTALAAQKHL